MRRLLIQALLIFTLPFFVVWAALETLVREIAQAPGYAWLAACEEVEEFQITWRRLRSKG